MWNVVASSFFVVVCIFSAVGDVDDGSFDDDVDDDDVVMVLVVEVVVPVCVFTFLSFFFREFE